MNEIGETNSIWKTVKRAELLLDCYGYYPTFHDAHVVLIESKYEERSVSITFEYSDLTLFPAPAEEAKSKATQIVLKWVDVCESSFNLYGNDIIHFSLAKITGSLRTQLTSGWGISGHIISRNLEVISIGPTERDNFPADSDYLNTVRIKLN